MVTMMATSSGTSTNHSELLDQVSSSLNILNSISYSLSKRPSNTSQATVVPSTPTLQALPTPPATPILHAAKSHPDLKSAVNSMRDVANRVHDMVQRSHERLLKLNFRRSGIDGVQEERAPDLTREDSYASSTSNPSCSVSNQYQQQDTALSHDASSTSEKRPPWSDMTDDDEDHYDDDQQDADSYVSPWYFGWGYQNNKTWQVRRSIDFSCHTFQYREEQDLCVVSDEYAEWNYDDIVDELANMTEQMLKIE